MLTFKPFAAIAELAKVSNGGATLKAGQKGAGVVMLQGGLVDLGFALPKTMAKGAPDGVFGDETFAAVKKFQVANGLVDDGIVGVKTLTALDKKLAAKSASSVPPTPAPVPVAGATTRNKHYQLGVNDPPIRADVGSGKWSSKPQELSYIALRQAIIMQLPSAVVIIGDDAVKHMTHYLGASGKTYVIDLEDMIEDVPSARECLEGEAAQAQEFAEMLPLGKHSITSVMAEPGYNLKRENWNWFFAIGGYSSWGKGTVTVSSGARGREYVLDFEYKFYDRYNWDRGKQVTIFGITITDEFMGEFHRQGLAREFDCVGAIKRRFTWVHGQAIPAAQFQRPLGQRP